MTSGTLKLVSLLLVVAAGGGVAWRAQQGILQSDGTSTENESAHDDQESAVYEESSSAESSREEISEEDAEPALTAAGWDVENSIGGLSRPPAAVKKFERQMPTKIREASIPSFPDGDEQTPAEEELTQTNAEEVSRVGMSESEKPTIDKDEGPSLAGESNGPAMLPRLISGSADDEESEPGASDPFGDQTASAPEEPVAAGTRDSETLEESSPVILAGNEEPADSPGKVKLAADTETEPTESMEDDPFSDSAPPEFSEESDKADKEAEIPAELGEGADPFSEESKPEAEQPSRGGKSLLKLVDEAVRSAIEPAEPPAEEQRSTKSQTTRNDGESTPDLIGGEPIRSRRSSTTKSTEAEPIPTLQPVPDHPRIGQPERDNMRERTSSTRELITDEVQSVSSPGSLDGDGVPEHDVPKGLQQPRLSIEKIAPKQAVLKQPFVYSVLVKNSGSADAHQVTVEDRIPKGTILEGTSPRAELVDKRLVWRLGTIKPDEQKKISIKVIPQEPGPIGSVAKVNFVAEVAAEIEITAPQIVLGVSSPSQVRLGDRLQMVFRVRNAGRADAENVVIRNVIPEGLRHPAGSDLEYAVGTLPAQDSREIKLDLVATKNGKVSNKTIITADGGVNLEEETDVEVVGEQLLLPRTGKTK
ncbi:MAG: hypothetical protein U0872_00645 [Planctomycetaceae bacterium]